MDKKYLIAIISMFINIISLVLIAYLFTNLNETKQQLSDFKQYMQDNYMDREHYEKLKLNIPNAIGITPYEIPDKDPTPNDTPLMAYEPVEYGGMIKKEEIPDEYELGDYWYIFYFDSPQLIQTVAGEKYLNKIEVSASTIDSLESFLDKNVTIKGRLSYGYAESRIILVDNVIVK